MKKAVSCLNFTLLAGGGLVFILTLFIDGAIIVVPIYDMQLYDRVLMSHNMDTLAMLSIACLIGLCFYALLDYLRSASFIAISETVAARLHRFALVQGVRRAAGGDRRAGPELIKNINLLQTFIASGALAVPLDAVCTILFIFVLFILHPAFGYLALVGICALISAGLLAELLVAPELKRAQERRHAANFQLAAAFGDKDLLEGLGMLPAIARRWCGRYGVAVVGLSRAASRAQFVGELSRLIRMVMQASVMVIGAVLVVRGQTTPGSLMGANLLVNKCLGPFDHLVGSCRSWIGARQAWADVSRVFAADAVSAVTIVNAVPIGRGLSLEGVDVQLASGANLLSQITAEIEPGTFVLLAGRNGSGKSTLLRVLAGVTSPTSGRVVLDGACITGGAHIGYLPQSVSLMNGSVAENIGRLTPDISEVFETAREVGIHELIGRMSQGYDTHLVGDAVNLSGAMRQRIGLARALYGSPSLLLLDEPDASLDGNGAAALLRAIRARCDRGAIAIVISHRPSMRKAADVVLELQGGLLVSPQISQPVPALQSQTA